LVTITPRLLLPYRNILIHTSVKLVTGVPCVVAAMAMAFLIHTSVKLVTAPKSPLSQQRIF
ncbi:hypothetical protein HMPREF1006_00587, partial [Synergistes sp. 3_1_syn1]